MDHVHCSNCIKVRNCKYAECAIISCKDGCQNRFHRCKEDEHGVLCRNALIACINQCNGCDAKFPRYQLAKHLSVCPANVVVCSFEWRRWGTEKNLMHSLKPVPRDVNKKHAEQLDIALTMRDQRNLIKELNGLSVTYSIDPYKLSILMTTSSIRKIQRFTTLEELRFRITTFWCDKLFRRDEYPSHYKNIHYDIAELLPRLEQRCPLFDAGCMFTQTSICPSNRGWKVTIAKDYGAVCVKPLSVQSDASSCSTASCLANLPQEVLEHIFSFLDTLSLLHMLKVNTRMKEIVWSRVKHRGVVVPIWKKKLTTDEYNNVKSSWKIAHMEWTFSTAMGTIRNWVDEQTEVHLSDHLKICPFYQRVNHKVPYFAFWPNHPEVKENALVLAKLEENVADGGASSPVYSATDLSLDTVMSV